jgi:hypothetical protein
METWLQKLRIAASCRNKSSKITPHCDIFVLQIRLTPGISPHTVPTERQGMGQWPEFLSS